MKTTVGIFLFVVAAAAQTSGGCGGFAGNTADLRNPVLSAPGLARTAFAAKPAPDVILVEGREQKPQLPMASGAVLQIQPRKPSGTALSVTCSCGSVDASLLTAAYNSMEVTILKGVSGAFRFDHVLIQEAKQFVSTSVTGLNIAIGRPGSAGELVAAFALMSPAAPENFWFERPAPPQVTATYDLVALFSAPSPLGFGNNSNFSSGSINWEVCGYNVQ